MGEDRGEGKETNMRRLPSLLLILAILFPMALNSCAPQPKTPLVVFAAGSLIHPFGDLEKAFESQYPEIDIQSEYHGSIQVMRHVTDLHIPIDVVATADQSLIPLVMYQTTNADTGKAYGSWYLRFATNKLALAYTSKSKGASEINSQNWMDILRRPDVKLGLADPRFDAVGYRALMVLEMANGVYHKADLLGDLLDGQFRYPVNVARSDAGAIIHVPEILETKDNAHVVLRGASMQVIALLQSGDVDYAFEYESVIQQDGLQMVQLPDSLNLGVSGLNEAYGQVSVLLDFQRFAKIKPQFKGEQIGYGITIPTNAPHPKEAALFVAFLLGPEGRKIMAGNHHPEFDPIIAVDYQNAPPNIQALSQPQP
jgi:molybdate/tungstate transport system substrate-binding protein